MVSAGLERSAHPLGDMVEHLEAGEALLRDSAENVVEVVGILKSYGVVLDAYSRNLIFISEHQFLELFPFFKYFDQGLTWSRLFRHWWHDRINYEYAEYCMRTMLWHGGGGLDTFLDTDEFKALAEQAIQAKLKGNGLMLTLHRLFPDFLPEQIRQLAYYSGLGQFWRVMADIFLSLSDRYDEGKIHHIPEVVTHIREGLVAAATKPITYCVSIGEKAYSILPESAGLTFLVDTAIPYVEAVFFRGTPFFGTVSYNAQAYQIPYDQSVFTYGALYADPLPIGGAGIPPTQLMQDMRHYLPDYLLALYDQRERQNDDLRVKICETFQKSMFCVTTAAIQGLAPYPMDTTDLEQRKANRVYLEGWMNRFITSRIREVNA